MTGPKFRIFVQAENFGLAGPTFMMIGPGRNFGPNFPLWVVVFQKKNVALSAVLSIISVFRQFWRGGAASEKFPGGKFEQATFIGVMCVTKRSEVTNHQEPKLEDPIKNVPVGKFHGF